MPGFSSPFSDRYGTETMRRAWSHTERFRLLSGIWTKHHNHMAEMLDLPLAKIADPFFHLSDEEMEEKLVAAGQLEKVYGHDIVALLEIYKRSVSTGGPNMAHTGLTSSDPLDQAILLQTIFSLYVTWKEVRQLLQTLNSMRVQESSIWLMGRTHLQPAEPTTLLHRFLLYAQDLQLWLEQAEVALEELSDYRGLLSGSVGNYANESCALALFKQTDHEAAQARRIKSQTLPRSLDLYVAGLLDQLAATLHKIAFDYRLESGFGNVFDQASDTRVGSSAMPYKRNPIVAESIDSLARYIHHLCENAWDNTAWQGLDRTLDDSANRRAWLPEAFIATSEIIERAKTVLSDYLNIESTDPGEWEQLWGQAREKTMNTVKIAMAYYGKTMPEQTKSKSEYYHLGFYFGSMLDRYFIQRNRNHLADLPYWSEHFNVATPRELLDVTP